VVAGGQKPHDSRLVERISGPTDARSNLVGLTARGKSVVDRAMAAHMQCEAATLAPLPDEDRLGGHANPEPAGLTGGEAARLADMAGRLPGRRIGQPEDIANAVGFLISDSLVTGTVLHAEGARLLV
jgi:NAD(P)-dependent dehydrogenase (short-subunit alcohol dehydrogenase family)